MGWQFYNQITFNTCLLEKENIQLTGNRFLIMLCMVCMQMCVRWVQA